MLFVVGFENQRYHFMVLPPGVGTLLEGKYGDPVCSKRYIYPHRAYPYLHNDSKQSVIKHQSQERVKKSKKTCLQPLLVKSYVAKVLPFHFF